MDEFTFAEKIVFEMGGTSIRSFINVGRCNALRAHLVLNSIVGYRIGIYS